MACKSMELLTSDNAFGVTAAIFVDMVHGHVETIDKLECERLLSILMLSRRSLSQAQLMCCPFSTKYPDIIVSERPLSAICSQSVIQQEYQMLQLLDGRHTVPSPL